MWAFGVQAEVVPCFGDARRIYDTGVGVLRISAISDFACGHSSRAIGAGSLVEGLQLKPIFQIRSMIREKSRKCFEMALLKSG